MDLGKIKAAAAKAADIAPATLPLDPETDLHVDGDYAAYYFSGNDETTMAQAKAKFLSTVRDVIEIGGVGGQVVIHLSAQGGDKGKRYHIATVKPYQGQRDSSRRPKNWEALRLWLEAGKTLAGTNWRVVQWLDREADDGVAAAARYAFQGKRTPVLFSRDKDFRMIPGRHVTWTTLERVEVPVGTFELRGPDGLVYGAKWFWMQMLMGDGADNIPGLEGQPAKDPGKFKTCGEACAETRLFDDGTVEEVYTTVRDLYKAYYGQAWADRLVEQASLLWLRTDTKADVGDFMRAIPLKDTGVEAALVKLRKRLK